jgi:large subunit ribosomal protein L17
MNHRRKKPKFGKTTSHRKAMFKNMCCSFLDNESMHTTLAKAKEFRRHIEPLITLAKVDSVHHRRLAFSKLRSKKAVTDLFERVACNPQMKDRQGGYVRVLKNGFRNGDSAPMAYVCFSADLDAALESE